MSFSVLLASLREHGDAWTTDVAADWLQGRSLFGGLQAALALKAMRALAPPQFPIRTLQGCFVGPVPAGPIRIRTRKLRSGKNTTHAQAQIVSGDEVLCSLLGVFGAGRPSAVGVVPRAPSAPTAKPLEFPYVAGITPEFTRHFSARWLQGAFPFTGAAGTGLMVELGMRDEGPVTAEHVLALADFVPPIALSMLKVPAPGSTLTWMVEFLEDDLDGLALDGWCVDATLVAARDGYSSQALMLWAPDGRPVARGNQSMVVFG